MRRALALAVVLACNPGATDDTADDKGEDSGATTDAQIPTPVFINPAVGEFIVGATQRVPEVFTVDNTIPGLTQVLLDALMLGTLGPDDHLGSLTEDTLELDLQGALIAGKHALQLANPSPEGPLDSVTLTMVIEPPVPRLYPTWRSELAATDLTGAALLSTGVGPGRLLGVVAPGDQGPVLHLLRPADDGGWQVDDPILVPLDGHVPDDMSQTPAVSATVLPSTGPDAPRLRVAYRVGMPGAAIAVRDITLGDSPEVLAPVTAFDLTAALAGDDVEWAAFGRPFLLGGTLLTELIAPADTEVPHPGDRRVITSFWRGDILGWTAPTQVGMSAPTDLDGLGPAPVVPDLGLGRAATLSLRIGRAYPAVLEASDDGAITITTPTRTAELPVSGDLTLTTIVGGFGGRTVAALDDAGHLGLSLLGTSGDIAPTNASPLAVDLPQDALPTGAPAYGVGVGFAFFLLPYGDAAPVHLVFSDGQASAVVALADPEPVHCDAVALAATLDGNRPDDPALAFACLGDGVLQVGRLIPEPHEEDE